MLVIGARTQLCGIVLHPAGHTRSPAMHNAAFSAAGIDAVYVAFDVTENRLGAAIAGARALRIRQLAVSIPHKESVIQHLDEVDEVARAIGAVNTVTLRDGRLVGTNTDWIGAVRAIERVRPLAGARAVVLGAGGTARAVVFGLLRSGARAHVLNRTRARATEVARALGADGAGDLSDVAALDPDLIVNTTSVGLREDRSPIAASAIPARSVVMDAVYAPPRTRLLRDAASRGAGTIEGKWMLILQAAEQFRIWTGHEAPLEVMERAFDSAAEGASAPSPQPV